MELSLVLLLELRLLAIALESLNGLSHALVGHPAFPFIGQGERMGYMREREAERERASRLRRSPTPIGGSYR
jgi:hypothetical protein